MPCAQALYAGIFAIAIWALILVAIEVFGFIPTDFRVAAILGVSHAAVATLVAWLAVRNNWGWHRS